MRRPQAASIAAGSSSATHDVEVRQRAPALVEPEPVAGKQLVGHGEADVLERDVVDEPAVRAVEERHGGEARRPALGEAPREEAERQPGVDDVLDDHDVTTGERTVEILEQPHAAAASSAAVGSELDHVELVVAARAPARGRRGRRRSTSAARRGGAAGRRIGADRSRPSSCDAGGDLSPVEVDRLRSAALRPQTLCGGRHEAMRSR